jgi:hypothetical protein
MRDRIRRFDKVSYVGAKVLDVICSARYWTDRLLFQSETPTADSRLVSRATLALHRPVGLLNLWSSRLGCRENYRLAGVEGFPRVKSIEGSSLFFIVRSFVLSLEVTVHYYDLC